MPEGGVSILRARKFFVNKLLNRKQMVNFTRFKNLTSNFCRLWTSSIQERPMCPRKSLPLKLLRNSRSTKETLFVSVWRLSSEVEKAQESYTSMILNSICWRQSQNTDSEEFYFLISVRNPTKTNPKQKEWKGTQV